MQKEYRVLETGLWALVTLAVVGALSLVAALGWVLWRIVEVLV